MEIEKICNEISVICESDDISYKENRQRLHDLFRAIEKIRITSTEELDVLLDL